MDKGCSVLDPINETIGIKIWLNIHIILRSMKARKCKENIVLVVYSFGTFAQLHIIWRISLVLDPANEKKIMPKIIIIKFCFLDFSTTRLGGSVWDIWDTHTHTHTYIYIYITHLFCLFLTPSQWDNGYIHDTINLFFYFYFLSK